MILLSDDVLGDLVGNFPIHVAIFPDDKQRQTAPRKRRYIREPKWHFTMSYEEATTNPPTALRMGEGPGFNALLTGLYNDSDSTNVMNLFDEYHGVTFFFRTNLQTN